MQALSVWPAAAVDVAEARLRVALVNMPFAMADRPSIQCGLLKAGLARCGHHVDVVYLNLELAAELGANAYGTLAKLRTDQLLGEWLFSLAAFGAGLEESAYREAVPSVAGTCQELKVDFAHLSRLRNEILPAWIQRQAGAFDWGSYQVVGFTSTFEQNAAAFALARVLKDAHPHLVTVFGGANFDGGMGQEYLRALPFIDYVVVGEGDEALPALVAAVARGESAAGLPGVVAREGGEVVDGGPAPRVRDLDSLPDPDYDDYFATLFRLGTEAVLDNAAPLLLFETARGCWWGEKQHCTFCGLNSHGMAFRSKSPQEASAQLRRLAQRYKIVNFEAVDNIMDHRYLEPLCAQLLEQRCDYQIFYEVKANLRPAQLRAMARAGITSIQPGIESLSSHVLALMRKGVKMLQNVRLLKWAYYYGMRVGWNILTGFPGETAEDYERQLQVIPLLRHLPPPAGSGRIWLERFSPYFFDPAFPVRNVRPRGAYRFVYPEQRLQLDRVAYFFDYEMDGVLAEDQQDGLHHEVRVWKERWQQEPLPVLVYQRAPDWIQVIDRRREQASAHALQRRQALIYEHCGETDRTVDGLREHLRKTDNDYADAGEVQACLDELCALGLTLEEDGHFLSLALPVNPNW